MPKNVTVICSTFLTDTHDFFILCETVEAEFKIFTVNLDHENPKLLSLFKYPMSSVKSKLVIDMHVRGSSSKEKINLNKVLMCFMLHENELYAWKDG